MGRPKLSIKKRGRGQKKGKHLERTGKGGRTHQKKVIPHPVTPTTTEEEDGYETEECPSSLPVSEQQLKIKRYVSDNEFVH